MKLTKIRTRCSGFGTRPAPKVGRHPSLLTMISLAMLLANPVAATETCTSEALGEAVDRIGASLRAFNQKSSDIFRPKLSQLAKKKNMTMPVAEGWVWQNLGDPRIDDYDRKIDGLIGEIDHLSDPKDATQNCAAIQKLASAEKQLTGLMRQRSDYVLQELDRHISGIDAKPAEVVTATAQKAKSKQPDPTTKLPKAVQKPTPSQDWATRVEADKEQDAPTLGPPTANPNVSAAAQQNPDLDDLPLGPAPLGTASELKTTFTVSEISEAGSGLFGNVSSHIAAAINGAFAKFGQPNAYVVGTEGGGAFLAGLRYGKGHVQLADGTGQKVYWTGPSIGTDLGADGSRVMFLIYNLQSLEQLHIRYPGIA
ncbi:MAG: DUF1134 domain-containing protein, partial [Alphaproteobacteria bacterium]|nr:DUF1134 domain-containing protein [Alphaproteobacteria bacterium]